VSGLQGELQEGPSPGGCSDVGHGELGVIASHLDAATPQRIVAWAVGWYGEEIVLASSFQDCVLIDIAVSVDPAIRVLFLDTGFHFPETLEYVELVRARYGLNLEVVRPEVGPGEFPCGTPECCQVRKVAPLDRALRGMRAWMTGIRRDETPERSGADVVEWDARAGRVKVNPLASWTQSDVVAYAARRGLPEHPLVAKGFASIGCAPTTRPVADGEHPRAGRWPDEDKTECGLHV
jgi:phosphoadenosine phosphosulfate reductase